MVERKGLLSPNEREYLRGLKSESQYKKRIRDKVRDIQDTIERTVDDIKLLSDAGYIDSDLKKMFYIRKACKEMVRTHLRGDKDRLDQKMWDSLLTTELSEWYLGKMMAELVEMGKPDREKGKKDFFLALHDSLFSGEEKYLTTELKERKKEIKNIQSIEGSNFPVNLKNLIVINNQFIDTFNDEIGTDVLEQLKISPSNSSLLSEISNDWVTIAKISSKLYSSLDKEKTCEEEPLSNMDEYKEKVREYIQEQNLSSSKVKMVKQLKNHLDFLLEKEWRGMKASDFFRVGFCKEDEDTALRDILSRKLDTDKSFVTKLARDISEEEPKILKVKDAKDDRKFELTDYGKCLRDSYSFPRFTYVMGMIEVDWSELPDYWEDALNEHFS